jgi:hypothetical protein
MDVESVLNEMKQLHNELTDGILLIRNTNKKSIPKAIRLGELLTWCKNQPECGEHGKWMSFLKNKVPFSQQSVSNYMRVYELSKEGKLPDVENLSDLYLLLRIEDEETQASLIVEAKQTGTTVRDIHARRAAAKNINVTPPETQPSNATVQRSSGTSEQPERLAGSTEPPPEDPDQPELPRITEHHWKLYRSRKIRERILYVLRSMHMGGGLDADVPEDLHLLRTMVYEDLGRKEKQLEREERANEKLIAPI